MGLDHTVSHEPTADDEPTETPVVSMGERLTPAAFAAEFERFYRIFWLVAAGVVGDPWQADDVVQDAALTALGKLEQFRLGTNFKAWMCQMVRFVALNHARKTARRGGSGGMDPDLVDPTHGVGSIAGHASPSRFSDHPADASLRLTPSMDLPHAQRVFDDQLVEALAEVNDVARACLLLRTIESLEYRDIARVLDIPEGTAMSHVHRTRRLLRDRLSTTDLNPNQNENPSSKESPGGDP